MLTLEPDNPVDPNAVAVYSIREVKIGYVNAERCGRIAQLTRAGHDIRAIFQRPAPFGAVIRVTFDGSDPVLPESPQPAAPPPDFWPDEEWPDM